MPPTIGAAMRFITSAPVRRRPHHRHQADEEAQTVIIFGRMRRAAPSTIASSRSAVDA